MTNLNDSEIDLGLALGITNQCDESSSRNNNSSSTGAGANANTRSRVDTLTFVGPGPLTELVWSTQNGLSIKCADKKHCILSGLSHSVVHTGRQNRTTAELLPLLANELEMLQGTDRLGLDTGLPFKIEDNLKEKGSSSAPVVEKMEETAENDVNAISENRDLVPSQDSSTDSKHKEESCREGGSHGSMESCNSANLLSKTNKRWRFEQQLILGSKRMKKQTQECPSVVKQDSSFMNWISNMVKGVNPMVDDQKMRVCDKTLSFGTKRLGFQSVFQSLYSPLETTTQSVGVGASKEIVLANPDDNLNQNPSGSLWITRLSPKTPSNHSDLKSFLAKYSSFDDSSSSFGLKKLKKPTITQDNTTNCFFCGKTGHGLRDCLEINDKEVEGILKNISLYEGVAKEAPCLCIKCFQLNHWASACPSRRSYSPSNVFSEKKVSNMNASSSAPKQMFDTIRRLRLSRTDILKWMNSRFPLVNLDGFFVRLRLAKWEEGAGYYVACITGSGSQGESPSKGSKKPIHVHVGGVECFVESRYVSNCDFLEDELVAWWQKTSISGRISMEEDLNSKLNDRKKLGF